jgi:hypothetical protein
MIPRQRPSHLPDLTPIEELLINKVQIRPDALERLPDDKTIIDDLFLDLFLVLSLLALKTRRD